jgi:tryptophanase
MDTQAPLPIFEPFRIRTVESLRLTTRIERERLLAAARYNLFALRADDVLIDLLTDSGTGAMSTEQWAAMMRADESYAGARSFFRFRDAVRWLTGMEHVIPTHQGRAAEHLLADVLLRPGDVVLGNTHFDTTRAHIEAAGAVALDLPCGDSRDARAPHPFKGNIDLRGLETQLRTAGERARLVIVTATNNALGGHPVHPANVAGVRELCTAFGVPLFLDAARFAENAALVRDRAPEFAEVSLPEVARRLFDLCDGVLMSAKKDGLVNIGGFLALRDTELATRLRERLVVTEGFPTYGGLAGRDLEAMAQGLKEVLDPSYLAYRLASTRYVAEGVERVGLPVVRPPGGHAVFIDAREALPHIPPDQFPAQSLACALYIEGGIRSVEIGTLMFGDDAQGDLLRLTIPRRVYTQSHMDYVVAICARVAARKDGLRGLRITRAPDRLRHFTAELEPL